MKKIIILAILAVGGYFVFNKGEEVIFNKIEDFAKSNIGKEHHINVIESLSNISKATIKITEYNQDSAKSQLNIVGYEPSGKLISFDVPLMTDIKRGRAENNGDSFGILSAVTTVDIDKMENVPTFINKDTFVIEHFVGINGDLREIYKINQISFKKISLAKSADKLTPQTAKLNFNGTTAILDSNILSREEFDLNIDFSELLITDHKGDFKISPFNYKLNFKKDGKIAGVSSPFSLSSPNSKLTIKSTELSGNVVLKSDTSDSNYSNGNLLISNISIESVRFPSILILDTIALTGGTYKSTNENNLNVKGNIDITPNVDSIKAIKSPIIPEKISGHFDLINIPKKLIELSKQVNSEPNITDEERKKEQEKVIRHLHNSGIEITFDFDVKTDKGIASLDFNAKFNDKANTMPVDEFVSTLAGGPKSTTTLITASLNSKLDKTIANETGATVFIMMYGNEYVTSSADDKQFIINAKLENSKLTVNGENVDIPD